MSTKSQQLLCTSVLLSLSLLGSAPIQAQTGNQTPVFDETTGMLELPCINFQGQSFSGSLRLESSTDFGDFLRPVMATEITGAVPNATNCIETRPALGSSGFRADFENLAIFAGDTDTGARFDVNTLIDPADPHLRFRLQSAYTSECTITAPPAAAGLDAFYTKYCDANGLPVISSDTVPDAALKVVREHVLRMTSERPDVLAAMVALGTRVAIMGEEEVTTDIPEHATLNEDFPGTDWDTRARGLGATPDYPASSAAEENVLCYGNDPYLGESISIHEFAHTVDIMGLRQIDPTWGTRLETAYQSALAAGLWSNTYAADNAEEYWAEGVQSWFNVNLQSTPSNGIHNEINTRAELASYDPALYALIAEVMPSDWQPACP